MKTSRRVCIFKAFPKADLRVKIGQYYNKKRNIRKKDLKEITENQFFRNQILSVADNDNYVGCKYAKAF